MSLSILCVNKCGCAGFEKTRYVGLGGCIAVTLNHSLSLNENKITFPNKSNKGQ